MKKYTIPAGHHSSKFLGFLPHFGFTWRNRLDFSAKFFPDCLYDLHSNDDYDTNKLYGFSTSYNHMIQSARIGWRCLDEENIEVMAYTHDENHFLNPQILGTVKPNEWFTCSIIVRDFSFQYIFTQNNISNVITVAKKTKGWDFKYKLYPYFGGNMTAPHKMSIAIKSN